MVGERTRHQASIGSWITYACDQSSSHNPISELSKIVSSLMPFSILAQELSEDPRLAEANTKSYARARDIANQAAQYRQFWAAGRQQNMSLLKGRGTVLEDCDRLTQRWGRKIKPMLSFRQSVTYRSLPARCLRTCVATSAVAPNSVYSAIPSAVASHEQPIFHIKFATRDPQYGTMGTIAVDMMNDQGM
ncbi:hypothetical protein E4U44_003519 [Claviceps purpurea]|nr:hypothetical protein E4U44_003519 [Claviceps purpurea]